MQKRQQDRTPLLTQKGIQKQSRFLLNGVEDDRGQSPDPLVEDSGRTRTASSDDEEPEDSVLEDMKILESAFRGIGRKYRLVNRIGEGLPLNKNVPRLLSLLLIWLKGPSQPYTKQKISTLTDTEMNGTLRDKNMQNIPLQGNPSVATSLTMLPLKRYTLQAAHSAS